MTMKYSRMLALSAVALFAAGACTDTTVEPKSTVTETNVFNDPNSYLAFIAKVYGGLAVSGQQGPNGQPDISGIDEGFSQYLRLLWEAQELPTDEAVIGWGDVGLPEMNIQLWAATNSFVVAMYYRIYFQVGMANEFLRQTTDDKLNSRGNVSEALRAQIQTYRAEARFLRALSFWHGIDLFGDIPLVKETDPLGATAPQQNTRAEIFDFIVAELTEIRNSLPPNGAASYGRATPAAASMLLTKLYLNAAVYTGTANYADALTAAQAAISGGYTLDPSFQHLFQADNNTSPEIIFAVTQDGLRTQTWGGMTFLIHASCGGSMDPAVYGIDGCWWGLRLKPEAYNRFATTDPRGVLLHQWPAGPGQQHRRLQRRHRRSQVQQPQGEWRQGVTPDTRRHRLPDVPPGRCVPDVRRGGVAWRWRQPGPGADVHQCAAHPRLWRRKRQHLRRRAHARLRPE